MVNLKENFGRRMALVCLAVAALVAIVVGIIAFNVSANAAIDGAYALDEAYLTTNIQAPRNADFTQTFKYHFAADVNNPTISN